jgi:hypothetical protein
MEKRIRNCDENDRMKSDGGKFSMDSVVYERVRGTEKIGDP